MKKFTGSSDGSTKAKIYNKDGVLLLEDDFKLIAANDILYLAMNGENLYYCAILDDYEMGRVLGVGGFGKVLLGKHNNMNEKRKNEMLNIKTLSLDNYKDNGKFKTAVESYKKYLIGLNKHFKQSENSDLFNIRDEILAALNKISYLLTLK